MLLSGLGWIDGCYAVGDGGADGLSFTTSYSPNYLLRLLLPLMSGVPLCSAALCMFVDVQSM
jgi:hypothetical protein